MRHTRPAATLALALAATAGLAATAAAATPERVRGTVSAVSADSLTVHTRDGKDETIALKDSTKYLKVLPSSLDKVEDGSYIGTATKTVGGKEVALEVVIFPPSMKGTGDGHYGWDRIPDTTLGGHSATGSAMTNGSVSAVSAPAGTTNSAMTNGSVSAASGKGGAKEITVTYKGGEQHVLVPPTAPIVTFQPGEKSEVTKGSTVFVSASNDGGKLSANAVAVGTQGANPPM